MFRIGLGYDSHRLVEGRALILGGEVIPHSAGLKGHSDGDALCHAITDAILGAASLGDIGRHFPDSDPQYKGANSLVLLARATALVREAGYAVENVDAVVIAEWPKLSPHVDRVRTRLAATLGVAVEAVSVKGKTNEGMDDVGQGAGMAVHAVALLRKV
jgi:2-C-methyl-D-erythritol 2,4-cyclodiphosphate synthase